MNWAMYCHLQSSDKFRGCLGFFLVLILQILNMYLQIMIELLPNFSFFCHEPVSYSSLTRTILIIKKIL